MAFEFHRNAEVRTNMVTITLLLVAGFVASEIKDDLDDAVIGVGGVATTALEMANENREGLDMVELRLAIMSARNLQAKKKEELRGLERALRADESNELVISQIADVRAEISDIEIKIDCLRAGVPELCE